MDNAPAPALRWVGDGGSPYALVMVSAAVLGLVIGLGVGNLFDTRDSATVVAAMGPQPARSTGGFRPPRSTGPVPIRPGTAKPMATDRAVIVGPVPSTSFPPTSSPSASGRSLAENLPVEADEPPPSPGSREGQIPAEPTPSTSPSRLVRKRQSISSQQYQQYVDSLEFDSIDVITPHLIHGTYVGNGQTINVLVLHRSPAVGLRVSPGDRPAEPVGGWAMAIEADAAVNGNWYNPFDGPAVSNGVAYGGEDHGYTALFGFTETGDLVAEHHRAVNGEVDPRVMEGVSGHPTLVHRGEKTTDFGDDPTFSKRHPRTAIGVTESVDVLLLVTVDGRRGDALGMTGQEMADLLVRLGVHDGIMLDGGGSTAMWISGRGIVNRPADPGRAVGNQLAILG